MHRGIKVHGYPNIGAYIDIKAKINLGAKHKCMDTNIDLDLDLNIDLNLDLDMDLDIDLET